MKDEVLMIIIAAITGSSFTILIQWMTGILRNRKLRKTINSILLDVIRPSLKSIEKEIPQVQEALWKFSTPDFVLGTHPSLNADYLRSFTPEDIHAVYKKDLSYILDSIAIIDNLQGRTPIIIFREWIKYCNDHFESHSEESGHRWPDDETHFINCIAIRNKRIIERDNLDIIQSIIDDLNKNIDHLTNK